MKRYCFDTSGLSNPLETIPEDIHVNIWRQVRNFIQSGEIGVTTEIYTELVRLPGEMGICIRSSKAELILEVNDDGWDWRSYLQYSTEMITLHQHFISEYNGYSKDTICMNDISIIALAKCLAVPVVSMEKAVLAPGNTSSRKRRIPDICKAEGVEHLTFNDFLRREGFTG